MSIKFIHTADLHLDSVFKSFKTSNHSSIRRKDIRDTFSSIIDLANNKAVDFLFISGDLYEHEYTGKDTIKFLSNEFKRLKRTDVVVIPGNHDPLVIDSWYKNNKWPKNVYILSGDKREISFSKLNTTIYGVGFDSYKQEEIKLEDIKVNKDMINIMLYHGTVDMFFGKKLYNPIAIEELRKVEMDYIALGHFHCYKDDYKYKNIINPGSPEPIGFDEPLEHGVVYGEISSSKELKTEFIKTAKRFYEEIEIDITGLKNDEQVKIKILNEIEGKELDRGIFRFVLKGYVDKDYMVGIEEIHEYLHDTLFYCEIKNHTVPDYDIDRLKNENGLKGAFVKKILKRIDESNSKQEKDELLNALYYGLEALENSKVDLLKVTE